MARRRVSSEWNRAYRALTERVTTEFKNHAYFVLPPPQIFHFTDCGGLIGILNSRTLWASLATSLNDRSEIEYGRVLVRNWIQETRLPTKALRLESLEQALKRQAWRVYVVSFCANPDTALHWLHHGRSGSGVAIGFSVEAIQSLRDYELCPVLYDHPKQTAWVEALVSSVDGALDGALAMTVTQDDRELLHKVALDMLATQLWTVTPRMKSAVFGAEDEWRLITYVPRGEGVPRRDSLSEATQFRSVSGRVVPYKRVKFDALPINEIVLGASAPIQQDRTALTVLLEEHIPNSASVKVRDSIVPVRS